MRGEFAENFEVVPTQPIPRLSHPHPPTIGTRRPKSAPTRLNEITECLGRNIEDSQ